MPSYRLILLIPLEQVGCFKMGSSITCSINQDCSFPSFGATQPYLSPFFDILYQVNFLPPESKLCPHTYTELLEIAKCGHGNVGK